MEQSPTFRKWQTLSQVHILRLRDSLIIIISLSFEMLKTLIAKIPRYLQSSQPQQRRNAIACTGDSCSNCVYLLSDRFEYPLRICKPDLWAMDISHLIMMLETRVARAEEGNSVVSAAARESPGQMEQKIDDVIRKDIGEVLRHEGISEEDVAELPRIIARLEELRRGLRRTKDWDLDEDLGRVEGLIRGWL